MIEYADLSLEDLLRWYCISTGEKEYSRLSLLDKKDILTQLSLCGIIDAKEIEDWTKEQN